MSLVFLAVNGQNNAVTYAGTNQPMWMVDHSSFITTLDDAASGVSDLLSNVNAHTFDVVMGSAPYLTAFYDGTNVNVTLHNAPATVPTSVTFSVLGKSYTSSIVNGVAKFPINVHSALTDWRVTVSVNVQGFPYVYVETAGVNVNTKAQAYQDSSGVVHAIPYYNTDLANYWTSQSFNPVWQPIDIATETGLTLQAVFGKILAALQQPTYTPIVLTADEQNGVNDLLHNVIPNIPVDLAHIAPVPASGQTQAFDSHYNSFRSHWSTSGTARQNYMQDVSAITPYVPLH